MMTLTLHQLMICGKTAHLTVEFTFTSKGEYSSTLLNLLTSTLNFKEGDMTWVRVINQRTSAVQQLAQNWFLFSFCKFETYINMISNHNSCCKSDSSNFCCMIFFFVKCTCPCTKCSYLIMNCFKITITDTRNVWLVWCNRYIDLPSHVVFGLEVGTGRAAATSARCSNILVMTENNFKTLQSWTFKELWKAAFVFLLEDWHGWSSHWLRFTSPHFTVFQDVVSMLPRVLQVIQYIHMKSDLGAKMPDSLHFFYKSLHLITNW